MSEHEPTTKRRKVRKGTQSCWDCRRRKVRCIFSAPTNSACDNCTRRKTPCVSQELSEPPSPLSLPGNVQLDLRLNRVEELIGQLSHPHQSCPSDLDGPSPHAFGNDSDITASISSGQDPSQLRATYSFASVGRRHSRRTADGFRELNCEMIAAWPDQTELDLICAISVGLSSQLHCGMCRPHPNLSGGKTPSTADLLRLPPIEEHPVLFARKLLLLGTFLQGAVPSAVKAMENQRFQPRQIMERVVDTAIRLVTTRDELLGSVEAIECIMLEAMYQNYSGNLHRSWMATRRAITVAQSMALHRGLSSPSLRFLESNARKEFDLDHLTFRLAEMDAYLSIMLGLQRSALETRHITCEKALAACSPVERMQRIHYMVQERIISRSGSSDFDIIETHKIDQVLREAAAEMSPRWWLTPNFAPGHDDETKIMRDMTRVMDQFSHYHLLIRLHLPYVLSPDRSHDYSKAVAVNTSRELLNRFLSFRASNPAHYYCRGSDFLAFITATILCIVHIKSSGSAPTKPAGDLSESTGFEFLAHSRLSDRGLMEQALDIIEGMYEPGTDAISTRISRILRDLLFIESIASAGGNYNVSSSEATHEELECDGRLVDGGRAMRVHIPNFGSIDFVRGTVSRNTLATQENPAHVLSPPATLAPVSNQSPNPTESEATLDEMSYLSAQHLTSCGLVEPSQQPPDGIGHDFLDQNELELPWTNGDHWDLQGVDFALFDSLFGGSFQVEDQTDTH
ncbi:hypothetical protein P171DRAFT_437322 [Karstenula rhodostoma CBS 690.94]|uniref:Zn(2)-C6 fungal-type domain-containing protein n=1 Tax=Karstenula rhodostoma CBS 690.94 TaxID=1392251 RepID=A0A9P4P6K7_9PLEO|nr:hypothetical protein P171DRAFT_437322 [Karstenula rhodostoma CBS 690.94]